MDELREHIVALLPRLRRFAYGLAGKQEDADDLVQAACERALERPAQWTPGTRLDSWLFRIIQTIWLDQLRARKVRGDAVDPDDLVHVADEQAHRVPEARHRLDRVMQAMAQLPEEQREVLMLVCVEEHSYRETAELLEIPLGTVMSRLARARQRLQDLTGE